MSFGAVKEQEQWNLATIERGGVLLKANGQDNLEEEGILNPAIAGDYLLYRSVAKGNYSRIMVAKLVQEHLPDGSTAISATKLNKIALEPEELYEKGIDGHGGVEDPRITRIDDGTYAMLYVGYGQGVAALEQAPMLALALSSDGLSWKRQGKLVFGVCNRNGYSVDLNQVANKDAVIFSEKINGRYAMFHRPMFSANEAKALDVPLLGIWYAESDNLLGPWSNHQFLFGPESPWEEGGVGAGVPPIAYKDFWLNVYHGFYRSHNHKHYSMGLFVTERQSPQEIIYRSLEPLLKPPTPAHRSHIIFPTCAWSVGQQENTWAIFWGEGDTSICWGLLKLAGSGG